MTRGEDERRVISPSTPNTPVLNNYINQGINPVPGSLWTNDDTFTSYPPGVERWDGTFVK